MVNAGIHLEFRNFPANKHIWILSKDMGRWHLGIYYGNGVFRLSIGQSSNSPLPPDPEVFITGKSK
jgi:hypothetical protein